LENSQLKSKIKTIETKNLSLSKENSNLKLKINTLEDIISETILRKKTFLENVKKLSESIK